MPTLDTRRLRGDLIVYG